MSKCIECGIDYINSTMLYDKDEQCYLCRACFISELAGRAKKGAKGYLMQTFGRGAQAAALTAAGMMFDKTLKQQLRDGIRPKPEDTPQIDKV